MRQQPDIPQRAPASPEASLGRTPAWGRVAANVAVILIALAGCAYAWLLVFRAAALLAGVR